MPFSWATEFSIDYKLSSKYEADIERLKIAGYIPKYMSVDIWLVTNEDGKDAAYSVLTSENKCVIPIGVTPAGKAWAIAKDVNAVEKMDEVLTHQVFHEVSHCILLNREYVHGVASTNQDSSKDEKFADVYGLAMTGFIMDNLINTVAIGNHILDERTSATLRNNHPEDDKYNTGAVIAKMINWMKVMKTVPDAITAIKMAYDFSGIKQPCAVK
jgi:hypothetical protein